MNTSSSLSDDLSDYDVISDAGQQSLESSLADLGAPAETPSAVYEPPPTEMAREKFENVALTTDAIQAFVRNALQSLQSLPDAKELPSRPPSHRTVRIYIDGVFDAFNTGHALQLRQAKLSFPHVYLIVGVFADDLCQLHETPPAVPHVERCEVVRHCRWVDEVLPDAPWVLDDAFVLRCRIDYIALEEGTSVDPKCDKARLKGYDLMKKLGKVIPTRRTTGLASNMLLLPPIPAQTNTATATPVQGSPEHFSAPEQFDRYGIGF